MLFRSTLFAIYCAKPSDTPDSAPQCFFMDHDGVIFRESPNIEGTLILKFTLEGPTPRLGNIVFSSAEINKFESWVNEFKERMNLGIVRFQFKQNAPKDIWLRTDGGFDVIVAKDSEPGSTASVVKTVLAEKVKEDRNRLEYIDARFGNKVFYKLR